MTTDLVDLVVEAEAWHDHLPDLASVAEHGARLALDACAIAPDGWEVAVLACDDARIAALNTDHRGKAQPTNVLSWPAFDLAPATPGGLPPAPPGVAPDRKSPLGDVAISLETCVAEAKNAQIPLKTHATHLILHSVLHLLGYDHQTDLDAERMEGIESRAMISAGLSDPYSVERQDRA